MDFISLLNEFTIIDICLYGLLSIFAIYIVHSTISNDPYRQSKIEEDAKKFYPTHFIPYKSLGDKEKVMLDMLEKDYDTKYDYSSSIKVAGSPVTSQVATKASFVITDPELPDNPIVYASPQFCKFTGYPKDEIENRNCRFLQGENTDPEDVKRVRMAIEEKREASVKLLNYKKDGTPFVNQFFICPLYSENKKDVLYYLGVQKEIDEDHLISAEGENAGYRTWNWIG